MNEYCTLFLPEALTIISKLPFSNPTSLFSDKKDETEYHYTHLEFALEWAPGFCYNSTDCTDTIPDTWTIEGLWPSVDYTSVNYTSVDYTTYPVNCTKECSITSSLKDQIGGGPMAKNGEKWRKMAKNGEKWRWRIRLFHLSNSPFFANFLFLNFTFNPLSDSQSS